MKKIVDKNQAQQAAYKAKLAQKIMGTKPAKPTKPKRSFWWWTKTVVREVAARILLAIFCFVLALASPRMLIIGLSRILQNVVKKQSKKKGK